MPSKVLDATCQNGIVTSQGVSVPVATVMSEGVASSVGNLIVDEEKAWYITKISPDLKKLITDLVAAISDVKSALDQVSLALTDSASALTIVDAKPVGGTGSAPAPGAAANITAITTAKGQIDALASSLDSKKTALSTFKDNLR